eukprot:TRINITY_DN111779_c0_g1_i1.p1 TRINITY_DN111779_c0_g1~~TRINITY_DN111779_c0_g1_i1.p1  ORF type:complete len:380 (+),score=53.38 TRINITY_DN111779_c0_g1_i1:54-1193(+)
MLNSALNVFVSLVVRSLWGLAVTVATLVCGYLAWSYLRPKRARGVSRSYETGPTGLDPWSKWSDGLRWSWVPSTGVLRANLAQPHVTENELCHLKLLAIHRPTDRPEAETAGDFPWTHHFQERKRLWEIRIQLRFKHIPEGSLYFGLEMPIGQCNPITPAAKQVRTLLLKAVHATLGDALYTSPGDDLAVVGEAEPPTCVMPMWAFDQFYVCEPGQEPELGSNLDDLGFRRTDGVSAYAKEMQRTLSSLSLDKVYTFMFWGPSQFVDIVNWQFRVPIPFIKQRMDINQICTTPPLYGVVYSVPGLEASPDRRHLISRKKYLVKVALWSMTNPPSPEILRQSLGSMADIDSDTLESHEPRSVKTWWSGLQQAMVCCTARA